MRTRQVDRGVWVDSFARKVFAVCPECAGPATVVCGYEGDAAISPALSRVHCLRCSFKKDGRDPRWLGPGKGIAKESCPHCGYRWLERKFVARLLGSEAPQFTSATCPQCDRASRVPIDWRVERLGKPHDPAFGLPLWLRIPCCGQTLWAYNREHLRTLKEYLVANLRVDVGLHWSMAGRLPAWMAARTNRAAVLGGIERLEKKLVAVEMLLGWR